MDDAEGRRIDFKNTLILLTSNVGSDLIIGMCRDPDLQPGADGLAQALRAPLLKVFPAALLGRLIVIPYYPLSDAMIDLIIRLNLQRIGRRIGESHDVPFTWDDEVVKLVASRCTEHESGGRMIDAILTNTLLPALSGEFLTRMLEGRPVERVHVGAEGGEFSYTLS
jgi:type VI secretion system protein VasG